MTFSSIEFSCWATWSGRMRFSLGMLRAITRSSRPRTSSSPVGPFLLVDSEPHERMPLRARVRYALAMSSGLTPCFNPPSVTA
jgi:hypothetical protein